MRKKFTRREFLHNSFTKSLGSVYLPSLATLLYNARAFANGECDEGGSLDAPAFIAIDLSGGGAIAGTNVIVRDKNGGLLTTYEELGLPSGISPTQKDMIDSTLGLEFHARSPMLEGIKHVMTDEAMGKINGAVFCTNTTDDRPVNLLSTAPGAFLGGARGSVTPLVGTYASSAKAGKSGGYSANPFDTSSVAPTYVKDLQSIKQLVEFSNSELAEADRIEKRLRLIQGMSMSQLDRFSQLGLDGQTREAIDCAYELATARLIPDAENVPNVDPKQDPKVSSLNPPSGISGSSAEAHSVVSYMVLSGLAGSGTITLTGYDYHDGSAKKGVKKDAEAGRVIGHVMEMADKLQRKTMLHVYTDGGVSTGGATQKVGGAYGHHHDGDIDRFTWTGDSGERSAAFVLAYDPAGKPDLSFQQLGAYKSSDGTIDETVSKHTAIVADPEAQAEVVVANWLAWQGREDEFFTKVKPNSKISQSAMNEYLFMKKS